MLRQGRRRSVHPHVHGERAMIRSYSARGIGSSPRTWGTQQIFKRGEEMVRFIPTYMGNARSEGDGHAQRPVHPHVHGERGAGDGRVVIDVGSSPRTWGTQQHDYKFGHTYRFIPTYMGNAQGGRAAGSAGTVHPHVHGERPTATSSRATRFGSSPRTWGTRPLTEHGLRGVRFIPTYMGNAPDDVPCRQIRSVHPHVHGERPAHIWDNLEGNGSSPRTWGTPHRVLPGLPGHRFIPTYMGNA